MPPISPPAGVCALTPRRRLSVLLLAFLLGLPAAGPLPAQPAMPLPQRWTGTVIIPAGTNPGRTAENLELRIFALSTDAEVAELLGMLGEGQMEARGLMRTFRAKGYLSAGKLAGAEVTVIRVMDLDNGRRMVRVYCDFPIPLYAKEVPRDTQVVPFGYLELEVDSTGAGGTGRLLPATSLALGEEGLEIDSRDVQQLEVIDVTSDRPPAGRG
jgi:hypothetical protein